jgi:hypothetical protein
VPCAQSKAAAATPTSNRLPLCLNVLSPFSTAGR